MISPRKKMGMVKKYKGGTIKKSKGGAVKQKMKNGGVAMTVASAKKLLEKNGFTVTKKKKEVMNGLFTKQHPTLQVLGAERVYSQSRKISWGNFYTLWRLQLQPCRTEV